MSVPTRPPGMPAVVPHLVCAGASAAIDFYRTAFGATELSRLPGPGGRLMHAMVRVGEGVVFLVDEMPEWGVLGPKSLGGSPVAVHVWVDDVDAVFATAIAAGATAVQPPADMFWGDRYGKLVDPFGHAWSLATHVRDVTPQEMAEAMRSMPAPPTKD